ncbi:hypothetical protein TgHK011_004855 [Trichoderma gracile]|nr:hypothetical protein TgHK011_004855 [Trichoderma gracile]
MRRALPCTNGVVETPMAQEADAEEDAGVTGTHLRTKWRFVHREFRAGIRYILPACPEEDLGTHAALNHGAGGNGHCVNALLAGGLLRPQPVVAPTVRRLKGLVLLTSTANDIVNDVGAEQPRDDEPGAGQEAELGPSLADAMAEENSNPLPSKWSEEASAVEMEEEGEGERELPHRLGSRRTTHRRSKGH